MSESQSVPVGESQSVPVVGDSFATIIINAHGADLREDRTTPEQHDTLRKLTMAGKSGHITYVARDVIDTMFHLAHQLAKYNDVPFTDKLKIMITELKKYKFGERLQDMYNTSSKDGWKSLMPTADDWFSLTNVSYNHEYHFLVNNKNNPWEIEDYGIWLVDGSPHVLQRFKDVPIIPPDSLKYYNIMASIGLPQWPDEQGTVTTLFEVADMIKATYSVKYVNFIDASCRFVYNPIAEADDVPMSEIASSTSYQPDIIQIGDIPIERRHAQPPDLPPGWVFGKNPRTGEYVYANTVSGEMSPDFPGTSADKQPKQPSGICVATLEGHREAVASVAFHPLHSTGRLLATGSWDKTAKVWGLQPVADGLSATCGATLEGHTNYVTSVAFNSMNFLATGSWDKTAKVWGLQPVADGLSAICVATLTGHTDVVNSVAFNSINFLATGSWDKTAKLWQLSPDNSSGTCTTTLKGHTDAVNSVAFHPTAALILATGSSDNTAKLWQLSPDNSSGTCTTTLKGHTGSVTSVAFHSTGRLIATGSDDKTAKLWDSSGTCVGTLEGHTHIVWSVAFHSTGFLATGSADRTVKLWNTKGCVATLMGHSKGVNSVAFNSTGTLLATGSSDNDAKLWDIGELWNKIKQENRAPGASGYMVRCYSEIDPPKMFGMPQTPPQGWIYVRGKPFGAKPFGNTPLYREYYMNDEGMMNPHFPGPYRAGSKKSSKKNKKKTKCLLIKIKKRQKNKSVKMK